MYTQNNNFNISNVTLDHNGANLFPRQLYLRALSGNVYHLISVDSDKCIDEDYITVLTEVIENREVITWVGTTDELIYDSMARAEFRKYSKSAYHAYQVPRPQDSTACFIAVMDLQNADFDDQAIEHYTIPEISAA